jgi:parallel beta-helix repeat protein
MRRLAALFSAVTFLTLGLGATGVAHAASCVQMTSGQADINSHGTGTQFCLSGTHNWTLTPKTDDKITGGILDGQNSTTDAIIAQSGVPGVTLQNIEIRNYLTEGDAFGAIHVPDPPNSHDWFLANLYVHNNGNGDLGAGSELGTGWIVIGGRYSYNHQEGLTAGDGASNDIVTSYGSLVVQLDHNSNANICHHEGGGFKWVANNITVQYAYVHDNLCRGLWADIGSNGGLVQHNRVVNNAGAGIMWEISNTATIKDNVVTGNGFNDYPPCSSYPWGAGIFVVDSGTSSNPITVTGNTVKGNCNGIVTDDGDSNPDGNEAANVHVTGNTVTNSGGTGYYEEDGDGPGEGQASGDTFSNNTITPSSSFCGFTC